jgi:hypothetical protein
MCGAPAAPPSPPLFLKYFLLGMDGICNTQSFEPGIAAGNGKGTNGVYSVS